MQRNTRRSFSKGIGVALLGSVISGNGAAKKPNNDLEGFLQFLKNIYKEHGELKDIKFLSNQEDRDGNNMSLVEMVLQSGQRMVFRVNTAPKNKQIITPVPGKWSEEIRQSVNDLSAHKYTADLSEKVEEMEQRQKSIKKKIDEDIEQSWRNR